MAQTQIGQLHRDDSNSPVAWNYSYLTATGTSVIKGSSGVLNLITINKSGANSVVTIYDSTGVSSGTIAVLAFGSSSTPVTLRYEILVANGIMLNVATSCDITVSYI